MNLRSTPSFSPLELWGGIECTVNRVRDEYFDQSERNGHAARESDLDLFAEIGLRKLRYPVLWERTAPEREGEYSWAWSDARLSKLRELGVAPIVTLLHHGSGPRYTDLLDPQFPEKLARYARAVAERYPWVSHYTPVNEPLTTARFSALYGHWYPHHRSDASFARALWNQCRGVQLAMREIQRVNPNAQLVQTEDMGKVFSTPRMAHQAHFENERRWLSFDLLCGRVGREHIMTQYLRENGIAESELDLLCELPCVPAIFGINYYATSERFLDERIERYAPEFHGSNGREEYADVEAARVLAGGIAGPCAMLLEAWRRYEKPLAITEVHLGCTREEQMRWLLEVWREAQAARLEGADVRAVTAWALLGTYDWNSLLTRRDDHYESGVFDLRAKMHGGEEATPRPTALFHMARALGAGKTPRHAALSVPGWWHREARLLYPPEHSHQNGASDKKGASEYSRRHFSVARSANAIARSNSSRAGGKVAPLLIVGDGFLARAFAYFCELRHLPHARLSLHGANSVEEIEDALKTFGPWALINAIDFARFDEANNHGARSFHDNAHNAINLAAICAKHAVALLTFSAAHFFNDEEVLPAQDNAARGFGVETERESEARVLAALPSALVVRGGAIFDATCNDDFLAAAYRALENGRPFLATQDDVIPLSYAPDLANVGLDLLLDGENGLWTLSNGALSPADCARRLARLLGADENLVRTQDAASCCGDALANQGAQLMPLLDDALSRYIHARREYSQQEPSPCATEWAPVAHDLVEAVS